MFRKSLLSAITIFLAGQFCLISESVTAGSFTDYIRNECPREYDLYKSAVTEFAIRMKPNVGQCGCDVVGLYYALSRNSMELVAQLEEDAELMQSAARVFGISEELTEALGNAPEAVSTLTILAEHDPRLFQKLSDALSLFSRSDRKKLSKNPNYILYYLLAAAMADAQGSGIASMVKRLKRRIAPDAMDVFSLLYTQTFSVYPHADTDYRFSAADATLGKLGMKNVRAIRPYKAHLALFLPPTEKEIPESQNLNKTEYEQLKEDHINLLVRVFQNISDKYGLPYGLKVVEHIAPHLMNALRFHNNKNQIGAYLDHESESRLFEEVLKNGVCQSGSGDGRLESFFSMYSPYSKKGEPLAGTKGNLGLIAKWFAEGNLQKYIAKADNLENYICSMAFLPRIFAESDPGQEKVFDDLLFSLSESPGLNGLFIAALYNKTDYFRWLKNSPDAFSAVAHNSDAVCGRTAPKYRYILTTSYPEDKSGAILHSFDGEHISASALNHLMYMDIDKLEEHNFTEKERDMALAGTVIEVADWTATAVSIAAIPFTAGASASVTAMMLARKGAITAAKRTIKNLGRRTLKSSMRLVGKYGRKAAWRESGELAGFAVKRGRKSAMEGATKKIIRKGAAGADYLTMGGTVAIGALSHFLANSADAAEPVTLCHEIDALRGEN